jgi:hypothetical protein
MSGLEESLLHRFKNVVEQKAKAGSSQRKR